MDVKAVKMVDDGVVDNDSDTNLAVAVLSEDDVVKQDDVLLGHMGYKVRWEESRVGGAACETCLWPARA